MEAAGERGESGGLSGLSVLKNPSSDPELGGVSLILARL